MRLDPVLSDVIVCPVCHGALDERTDSDELACRGCGLVYPVRDDIPVLLVDHARQV